MSTPTPHDSSDAHADDAAPTDAVSDEVREEAASAEEHARPDGDDQDVEEA